VFCIYVLSLLLFFFQILIFFSEFK